MSWRPESWKNPYPIWVNSNEKRSVLHTAFEEGADAMLKAIEESGEWEKRYPWGLVGRPPFNMP